MEPESARLPSIPVDEETAKPRSQSRADFLDSLRNGVGKALQLEFRKGAPPRKFGAAVRGTIKAFLESDSDVAVVLTNVEVGRYAGEPIYGGGFLYERIRGEKIVKLSEYSDIALGNVQCTGSLFG